MAAAPSAGGPPAAGSSARLVRRTAPTLHNCLAAAPAAGLHALCLDHAVQLLHGLDSSLSARQQQRRQQQQLDFAEQPEAVALSVCGRVLAVACPMVLYVYRTVPELALLQRTPLYFRPASVSIARHPGCPDGNVFWVAVGSPNGVDLHYARLATCPAPCTADSANYEFCDDCALCAVAFSDDSRFLATATSAGAVGVRTSPTFVFEFEKIFKVLRITDMAFSSAASRLPPSLGICAWDGSVVVLSRKTPSSNVEEDSSVEWVELRFIEPSWLDVAKTLDSTRPSAHCAWVNTTFFRVASTGDGESRIVGHDVDANAGALVSVQGPLLSREFAPTKGLQPCGGLAPALVYLDRNGVVEVVQTERMVVVPVGRSKLTVQPGAVFTRCLAVAPGWTEVWLARPAAGSAFVIEVFVRPDPPAPGVCLQQHRLAARMLLPPDMGAAHSLLAEQSFLPPEALMDPASDYAVLLGRRHLVIAAPDIAYIRPLQVGSVAAADAAAVDVMEGGIGAGRAWRALAFAEGPVLGSAICNGHLFCAVTASGRVRVWDLDKGGGAGEVHLENFALGLASRIDVAGSESAARLVVLACHGSGDCQAWLCSLGGEGTVSVPGWAFAAPSPSAAAGGCKQPGLLGAVDNTLVLAAGSAVSTAGGRGEQLVAVHGPTGAVFPLETPPGTGAPHLPDLLRPIAPALQALDAAAAPDSAPRQGQQSP